MPKDLRRFLSTHVQVRYGANYIGVIIVNTNKQLLQYLAFLLRTKFDVRSYISLEKKRSHMWSKLPCYRLTINRREDQRRFAKRIGFGIQRKNQKMLDALKLLDLHGTTRAAPEWQQLYEKHGRVWIKRTSM